MRLQFQWILIALVIVVVMFMMNKKHQQNENQTDRHADQKSSGNDFKSSDRALPLFQILRNNPNPFGFLKSLTSTQIHRDIEFSELIPYLKRINEKTWEAAEGDSLFILSTTGLAFCSPDDDAYINDYYALEGLLNTYELRQQSKSEKDLKSYMLSELFPNIALASFRERYKEDYFQYQLRSGQPLLNTHRYTNQTLEYHWNITFNFEHLRTPFHFKYQFALSDDYTRAFLLTPRLAPVVFDFLLGDTTQATIEAERYHVRLSLMLAERMFDIVKELDVIYVAYRNDDKLYLDEDTSALMRLERKDIERYIELSCKNETFDELLKTDSAFLSAYRTPSGHIPLTIFAEIDPEAHTIFEIPHLRPSTLHAYPQVLNQLKTLAPLPFMHALLMLPKFYYDEYIRPILHKDLPVVIEELNNLQQDPTITLSILDGVTRIKQALINHECEVSDLSAIALLFKEEVEKSPCDTIQKELEQTDDPRDLERLLAEVNQIISEYEQFETYDSNEEKAYFHVSFESQIFNFHSELWPDNAEFIPVPVNYAIALRVKSGILNKLDRYEDALAIEEKLYSYEPGPWGASHIIHLLRALGRTFDAKKFLEQQLPYCEDFQDLTMLYYRYAAIFSDLGMNQEALLCYRYCEESVPQLDSHVQRYTRLEVEELLEQHPDLQTIMESKRPLKEMMLEKGIVYVDAEDIFAHMLQILTLTQEAGWYQLIKTSYPLIGNLIPYANNDINRYALYALAYREALDSYWRTTH